MQEGIGTYTFDTASHKPEWSKAGDWVLPFCGKAEYVPDLKLWFAFSASSSSPHSLCALDLPAMNLESPPELQRSWDYLDLPDSPYRRHLVNLGSGKFCIVSFFKTSTFNAVNEIIKDESAVFTGLEVRRCNGAEGPVRMIKHMSKRYNFQKYIIHCVFWIFWKLLENKAYWYDLNNVSMVYWTALLFVVLLLWMTDWLLTAILIPLLGVVSVLLLQSSEKVYARLSNLIVLDTSNTYHFKGTIIKAHVSLPGKLCVLKKTLAWNILLN